ncbi:uncharacterized protein DUF4194 [Sinobacterium caligoides]|uniref:Uncharacterized protein DUF4194 n=1 Tax=Sinobacterium caligoides TaxID=933926 RepID=A0A3N2DMV9_9GAMM|nr:DUF4194 domain-containing protein [Sinobacterium caligoides]ROS01012.1 uncharacterized protein DUF4194 [Sinobacterium caligoides]
MLEAIKQQLDTANVSQREFSELVIRLLDRGVIYRDDSNIERDLYDRYLRLHLLVEDYLEVLGVRLLHDSQFQYVLAFPPGSEVPGLADDTDRPLAGLKSRLNQAEVALVLVLRAEYDKSLREGQIDELGQVSVPIEAVSITMKNLLNRSLPENALERKKLFARLRSMRLIQLLDEGESSDSWVKIRPSIVSFVSEAVLESLADDLQQLAETEVVEMIEQDEAKAKAKQLVEPESEPPQGEVEVAQQQSGFEEFELHSSVFAAAPETEDVEGEEVLADDDQQEGDA